jgi:Protein of unknown function (DUF3489)
MTYLSDAGRVVLSNAAQRDDLSVLPLPETLAIKGGAVKNVLAGLTKRGLIRVIDTDGGPERVIITSEGMAAIGVEPDDEGEAPDPAELDDYPSRGTPADQGAWAARRDDEARAAERAAEANMGTADPKPTVRPGTKQALLIDLLKRPKGATVEQIAERTGWQRHTIRGAISGALKKKLGLTIEATRVRNVGPNQTGAKGSTTVYRIVE